MIGPSGNLTSRTGKIHHFQWENPLQMVIFNSYVKFPEGNMFSSWENQGWISNRWWISSVTFDYQMAIVEECS